MKKILVVDDEPSMRELLAIMLRREGFGVEVADSRATAARVLATGAFDLVITDVKLPDGDGIEILRHLKAARDVVSVDSGTASPFAAMIESSRRTIPPPTR